MSRQVAQGPGPSRLRSRQRRKIHQALLEKYGNRCYYCTRPFGSTGRNQRTLDHKQPLSRGGTHDLCNLVLSCSKCNNAKGDLTSWEYMLTPIFKKRRAEAEYAKNHPPRPPRPKLETITRLEVLT